MRESAQDELPVSGAAPAGGPYRLVEDEDEPAKGSDAFKRHLAMAVKVVLAIAAVLGSGGAGYNLREVPAAPAPPPPAPGGAAPVVVAEDVAELRRRVGALEVDLGGVKASVVGLTAHTGRLGDGLAENNQLLRQTLQELGPAFERLARIEGALGVESPPRLQPRRRTESP